MRARRLIEAAREHPLAFAGRLLIVGVVLWFDLTFYSWPLLPQLAMLAVSVGVLLWFLAPVLWSGKLGNERMAERERRLRVAELDPNAGTRIHIDRDAGA